MAINTSQIHAFLTVVQEGSIAKAAGKLYITGPALIKQMNLLEASVGVRLLNRSNRGIRLTEAGQVFYDGVSRQMKEFEAILTQTRKAAADQVAIRLGVYTNGANSKSFYSIISSFAAAHPDIRMDLIPTTWDRALDELMQGRIDFCEHYPMNDRKIGFARVNSTPFVCMMSPMHPLASKAVISRADLAGYTVYSYSASLYSDAFRNWCEETPSIDLKTEIISTVDTLMQECLRNKLYIIPEDNSTQFKTLVYRPLDTDIHIDYGLIYRKRALSPAGEMLLRHLKA